MASRITGITSQILTQSHRLLESFTDIIVEENKGGNICEIRRD